MSGDKKPPTPEQAARDKRRAEALRANLKRRKASSRPAAPETEPDKD